jgi:hypothetical protein
VIVVPFVSLALLAAVIASIYLPETMGKELCETLEEMEDGGKKDEPQSIKLIETDKKDDSNS